MRKMLVALFIAAFMSVGCASAIGLGVSACEAVIGGSEASSLCGELDKLREGDQTAEAAAAAEAAE